MQLWGRMAQQQAAHHQQQQQPQSQPGQQLTGLASGLRPHYFAKSSTLSAILAGKPSSSAYTAPTPSSSTLRSSTTHNQSAATPTPQQAMLASIASQTLLGKLGSAFWDAFSGGSSSSGRSQWDADKVRRVLEGKAVVRVVDIEATPAAAPPPRPIVQKAGPSRTVRMSNLSQKPCQCDEGSASKCLTDMFGTLRI